MAWVLHERAAEPHQGAGLGERCGAWPSLSWRLHEGVCAPRLRLPDVHASEGLHPRDVQADARVALSAWYRSLVLHGVSATGRSISPHALRRVLVRVRACMLLSAVRIVIRKLLPRRQSTFALRFAGNQSHSTANGSTFCASNGRRSYHCPAAGNGAEMLPDGSFVVFCVVVPSMRFEAQSAAFEISPQWFLPCCCRLALGPQLRPAWAHVQNDDPPP